MWISIGNKGGVKANLDDYWIGLGGTMYGIHGTDIPWSVGCLVTDGCIRMYPEDIKHDHLHGSPKPPGPDLFFQRQRKGARGN